MTLERIEVVVSDQLGKKVRIKMSPQETIADLKKHISALTKDDWTTIQLKKWSTIYKDTITLQDYEICNGMTLELRTVL